MAFISPQLTSYKRPSEIIVLDALPATSTGNDEGQARYRDYASPMDSDVAVTRACELIEGLSP